MQRLVLEKEPAMVVIDPVSSLARGGTAFDVSAMLMRQVYYLKSAGITAVMTVLTDEGELAQSIVNVSSLVDTSVELVMINAVGERNRGVYVLKSRGTAHSNQIREFLLGDSGVEIIPVVIGAEGVLTGSARITAGSAEGITAQGQSLEAESLARALEHRRETVDAHVASLRADFEAEERLTQQLIEASEQRGEALRQNRIAQGRRRSATHPEDEP
ncbi:MAG: circadian clock protein KaiC, partial [Actinomycetota bacterium]|nr:circadian clock protein KaiC [Actinomycetota bacterium]